MTMPAGSWASPREAIQGLLWKHTNAGEVKLSKEHRVHETLMVCVYDACEGHVEQSRLHLMNSHVVFLGQECSANGGCFKQSTENDYLN